jgi:acyl-CoA reductase-like NAD-dependent aldehyde dehydrogenase
LDCIHELTEAVTNPATGQRLGTVPVATPGAIDDAVEAAVTAFNSWMR